MDVPIYFRTDSTAHLYPMSKGYHGGHPFDTYFPFMISGSVPQMETAHILHKTSSGSGWETGDSRIANVLFALTIRAFIVFGIIPTDTLPGQKNHRNGIDPNALSRLLSAV